MDNPVVEIQKQYADQLERAAYGYLSAGFGRFIDEQKQSSYPGLQSTIGHLGIAIELMLKAYIASKSLLLLFKSLPIEIRILLTNPESVPVNFNWSAFEIELRAASYQMIELDECIALFYLFFPNTRSALNSYLRGLAKARNASVHSVIPVFQVEYEAQRVIYIALRICDILKSDLILAGGMPGRYPELGEFTKSYRENEIDKVHKAVESAKERAKKLPAKSERDIFVNTHYWEQDVARCPVCGNLGILNGTTERITWTKRGDKDISEPGLWFYPDNFECQMCGLKLDDYDEMKLGGIDIDSGQYDRSEDLDDFAEKNEQTRSYKN